MRTQSLLKLDLESLSFCLGSIRDHVAAPSEPTCYPAHDHRSAASCHDLREPYCREEAVRSSKLPSRRLFPARRGPSVFCLHLTSFPHLLCFSFLTVVCCG